MRWPQFGSQTVRSRCSYVLNTDPWRIFSPTPGRIFGKTRRFVVPLLPHRYHRPDAFDPARFEHSEARDEVPGLQDRGNNEVFLRRTGFGPTLARGFMAELVWVRVRGRPVSRTDGSKVVSPFVGLHDCDTRDNE